ncbi:hypothetical protein M1563_01550 [Patescibacteria group bacterium]|nr:hypothetical protein [Patescibacteria group bacterium]
MNNKKVTLGLLVGALVLIIAGFLFTNKLSNISNIKTSTQTTNLSLAMPTPEQVDPSQITFFYSASCPHCLEVEQWMQQNNFESQVPIVKKEVSQNQKNSQELIKTAVACGLPVDTIGVPFLAAEGQCYIGTPDVIKYLSKKLPANQSSASAQLN